MDGPKRASQSYAAQFHVVLVEPQIPQNTGNIGRTCVGFLTHLHLVGPLGFELRDRWLKRAGLDYWEHLEWFYYPSWRDWLDTVTVQSRLVLFSAKSDRLFYEHQFQAGDILVFGQETQGLPQELMDLFPDQCFQLPMPGPIRGYNLATSVAMALTEAWRQVFWANPYLDTKVPIDRSSKPPPKA